MNASHHLRSNVSVIIPVFNGADTIGACLYSLVPQLRCGDEVIVVDDGSTDNTGLVVDQFTGQNPIRLIRQDNAGPAAARNRGAKEASQTILLFTDADCRPCPDWIDALAGEFQDPTVMGARGEYLSDQKELSARWVQFEYGQRYKRMRALGDVDFIDTYSAAYRASAFHELGGFDTSFPTASTEDQEFSFRMAEKGMRMVHVRGARVYHRHNRTLKNYARRKFYIGYWKVRVLGRHPGKAIRDTHTPQVLKFQMLLIAAAGACVVAVPFNKRARRGVAVSTLAFLGTTVPSVSGLRHEPQLALRVPLYSAVRAVALLAGLQRGVFAEAQARCNRGDVGC